MWQATKGASSPAALLESWGFVSATKTAEGDAIWVNPKTFRGGDLSAIPGSVPSEKHPAEWWAAGGTLLPALAA